MRASQRHRPIKDEQPIDIDGMKWSFVLGPLGDTVMIIAPEGRKTIVKLSTLTEMSDAERAERGWTLADLPLDALRTYVRKNKGNMTGDPAVVGATGRGRRSEGSGFCLRPPR
jgi:hypothetical protein